MDALHDGRIRRSPEHLDDAGVRGCDVQQLGLEEGRQEGHPDGSVRGAGEGLEVGRQARGWVPRSAQHAQGAGVADRRDQRRTEVRGIPASWIGSRQPTSPVIRVAGRLTRPAG